MRISSLLTRLSQCLGLSVAALALVLAGCGGSGSSGSGDGVSYAVGDALADSTLAVVVSSEYGADTLTASQYQRRSKMRMQRLSPDQRNADTLQSIHRDLVRRFVGGHMLRGRAKAEDVAVDSAQLNRRLQQIKQRYQSEAQLQKQLAQNDMTMDSLRNFIGEQLQTQALQRQMADQAQEPTSSEVEEYSKKNRSISAQHILIRAGQNAPQSKVDSARQAAAALIDSAEAGTDFGALARRHSEGPSANQGGNLGSFTKGQMVEEFSNAAFALADSGDIASEPVRTRYGFHVIRLTNAGEPMDTSKARQQMMQERRKEAVDAEVEKLMAGATVHVNPDLVEAGLYE